MSLMLIRPVVKQHLPERFSTLLVDEMIQLDQVDALADQHAVGDQIRANADRDQKKPGNKCRQFKFSACVYAPLFTVRDTAKSSTLAMSIQLTARKPLRSRSSMTLISTILSSSLSLLRHHDLRRVCQLRLSLQVARPVCGEAAIGPGLKTSGT